MYMYNPYSPMVPQQMYDPGKRRDKTETGEKIKPSFKTQMTMANPYRRTHHVNSTLPVLMGQQQNPNTQDIDTSALAPHIGNAPAVLMQQGQQQQPDPVLNQPFYPTPTGNMPAPIEDRSVHTNDLPPVVQEDPQKKLGFGDKLMRYMSAQEARGETPLSQKLIAAGAAMQGNSHLGGNAAMAAAGNAYNEINQSDMTRKDAYRSAQAEKMQENMDLLNQYDAQDQSYSDILQKFDKFDDTFVDPTGLWDGTVGSMIDKYTPLGDPEREAFRYELRQTIVDNTLLNTAQTKGAISDREMALFQSGVPSLKDSPDTWRAWIKARQANLKQIRYRLANNIKVSQGADVGFDNTYTAQSNNQSSQSSQPPQRTYTQEEDDALFE